MKASFDMGIRRVRFTFREVKSLIFAFSAEVANKAFRQQCASDSGC